MPKSLTSVFQFTKLATLGCFVCVFIATGDPITLGPGIDDFFTPPGATAMFPGLPVITFQGVPLSGASNTDTEVQRLAGGTLPDVGSSITVPIEIVKLSLESTAPVNIGGSFFDVFATLAPGPEPLGSMTITYTRLNEGGTYNATSLPVDGVATFTEVGNPSVTFTEDFSDTLHSVGAQPWSVIPTPAYPGIAKSGGFYACDIAGSPQMCLDQGASLKHPITMPKTPEPAALLLTGLGLAAVAGIRRSNV